MSNSKKLKHTDDLNSAPKWVMMLLFGFSFLIYANSIPNDYNMDDELVTRKHRLTSKGIKGIPDIFTSYYYEDDRGYRYEYRPMVHLTFAIEHSIFGEEPTVSHFINVLLYSLLVVLLFITLRRIFFNYNYLLPLVIALLFAAHPLHTEVVASIKNRDELLSLLAGIGALYLLFKAQDSKSLTAKANFVLLTTLLFVIALMAKRSSVSFVAILPVALILFRKPGYALLLAVGILMAIPASFFAPFYFLWQVSLFGALVAIAPVLTKFIFDKDYLRAYQLSKMLGQKTLKAINTSFVVLTELIRRLASSIFTGSKTIVLGIAQPFVHMVQAATKTDTEAEQQKPGYNTILFWTMFFGLLLGLTVGAVMLDTILLKASAGLTLLCFYLLANEQDKLRLVYVIAIYTLVVNINFAMEFLLLPAIAMVFIPVLITGRWKQVLPYVFIALLTAQYIWIVPDIGSIIQLSLFIVIVMILYIKQWRIAGMLLLLLLTAVTFIAIDGFALYPYFYLLFIPSALLLGSSSHARALGTYVLILFTVGLTLSETNDKSGLALGAKWQATRWNIPPEQPPAYVPPTPPGPTIIAPQIVPQAGRELRYVENFLPYEKEKQVRVATSFYVMGKYLQLCLLPHPLSFYYGFAAIPIVKLNNIWVILSIVIHLLLIIGGFYTLNKHRGISFGIFVYLVALLPFSNLVIDMAGMVGERFAFVATTGFCILIAYLLLWLLKVDIQKTTLVDWKYINTRFKAVLIIMLVLFSTKVVWRNAQWKDHLTLFKNDIEHLEKSAVAHNLIANHLIANAANQANNLNNTRRDIYIEARNHYKSALAIYPEFFNALVDLGRTELLLNNLDGALQAYVSLIKVDSTFSDAYLQIALIYEEKKELKKAIRFYEKTIELSPKNINAYTNLSFIYFRTGNIQLSIEVNERAIQENPNAYEPYVNIGKTYYNEGQAEKALPYFLKAYELAPNEDLANIINQIRAQQ